MKRLDAYLFFDGNCAEAMRFYQQALGGELRMLQAKEAPDPSIFGAGNGEKIMHAKLESGEAIIMASDWLAPDRYPGMGGFSVTLLTPTVDEAKSAFDKLAEGGRVNAPFGKTFYSDGFGMLTDRFGTPWMVMADTNTQG